MNPPLYCSGGYDPIYGIIYSSDIQYITFEDDYLEEEGQELPFYEFPAKDDEIAEA